MKWYGNVTNRIEEGKNYESDKTIKVGTDITMYHWSDRTCYFVTKVNSQKNIFVRRYYVCADHDKKGGMGHQDWLYFKSYNEEQEYLKKYFEDKDYEPREEKEEEWELRYNHWNVVTRWTLDSLKAFCDKEHRPFENCLNSWFTDKQREDMKKGKEVKRYRKIDNGISFGIRDYYYDWEF